jgi:hypothetical protein
MEYLIDFLNETQKNAISDYKYIPDTKIQTYKMKKGDYIKFILKENYKFMEGGIIININQYPIVTIKSYQLNSSNYSLDLTKVYVFYKKNNKNQTRREYFEEYLKNLSKKS